MSHKYSSKSPLGNATGGGKLREIQDETKNPISNNWNNLRRVVTGVDENGRSKVIIDDNLPSRIMFDDFSGLHEVWTDPGNPLDRRDTADQTERPVVLAPEKATAMAGCPASG